MQTNLETSDVQPLLDLLTAANARFIERYPGIQIDRQPVHTFYGGANLYKAGIASKLGGLALRHFTTYAPEFASMAAAVAMQDADQFPREDTAIRQLQSQLASIDKLTPAGIAMRVYQRVLKKLQAEAIEDQRIDFEDGYGARADAEEDAHAAAAAKAMAEGLDSGTLPAFNGIRIKALTEECKVRALRTLDIFLATLTNLTKGQLPNPFFVTLPKVTSPEQVSALCQCIDLLESKCGIDAGTVRVELMIETIQSVLNPAGACNIPALVAAGKERVSSAILGTFDYTASANIASSYQDHRHPSADFARQMMQASLTGTRVTLCDGITNIMPVAPHKGDGLTEQQLSENRETVHAAWKIHFDNIMHSLKLGFYQSWDLNPAQLPVRYMAVYYFFLSGLSDASARLKRFIDQATQASMVGNTFDDAASAQGLLNFFITGMSCGAIVEEEALSTGLTLDELYGRSFMKIVENRSN